MKNAVVAIALGLCVAQTGFANFGGQWVGDVVASGSDGTSDCPAVPFEIQQTAATITFRMLGDDAKLPCSNGLRLISLASSYAIEGNKLMYYFPSDPEVVGSIDETTILIRFAFDAYSVDARYSLKDDVLEWTETGTDGVGDPFSYKARLARVPPGSPLTAH
jgi:hypothetical protein